MTKQVLSLFLAAAFLLSACGGQTTPPPEPPVVEEPAPEPPGAEEPETPADEEPVGEEPTTPAPPPELPQGDAEQVPVPPETEPAELAALPNEQYSWWYGKKQAPERPSMDPYLDELVTKYDGIWIAPDEPVVYLTMDSGYEKGLLPSILDTLKKHDVKVTFFVTGATIRTAPEAIERMVAEGHTIGNHTVNHPRISDLSYDELKEELFGLEEMLEPFVGERTRFMRPPEGVYSERALARLQALGYRPVFWSLAIRDWVPQPGGAQDTLDGVLGQIHPGAVILLHTVSEDNEQALDQLLTEIKARGYTFGQLEDL